MNPVIKKLRCQCADLKNEVRMYRNIIEGLHQGLKLDCLFKLILQTMREELGFRRAGIFLLTADNKEHYLAMGIDEKGRFGKCKKRVRLLPGLEGSAILSEILAGQKLYYFTNKSCADFNSRSKSKKLEGEAVNTAIVPIQFNQGRVLGALAVDIPAQCRRIGSSDVSRMTSYATQTGSVIQSFRVQENILNLSITDPLTGLHNRRFFDKVFKAEVQRCQRLGYPLGLIMVDVDHFKRVNDSYGHSAGDEVLRQISALLRTVCPNLLARIGGEEFALLMPDVSLIHLQAAAHGLQRRMQEVQFNLFDESKSALKLTLSVGLASYQGGPVTPQQIFKLADQSLFEAKRNGRNRIGSPQILSSAQTVPFIGQGEEQSFSSRNEKTRKELFYYRLKN